MVSNGNEIEAWSLEGCSRNGFEFRRGRVGAAEEELGSMPFADELFGNGQVKPLKLPPRLLAGSELGSPSPSRSTSGGLKHVFWQIWSEDSDPFRKAAEKVRKGEKWGKGRRSMRSGSVSPLGVHQWTINDLNTAEDVSRFEQKSESCAWSLSHANPLMIEPRGLAIARKLRPLSMNQGKDIIIKQVQKPSSPVKEPKHKLEGLLSRSYKVTWEWTSCQGSKNCGGNASQTELNKREIKTVVQYRSRPKMLLCLGFHKAC